MGDFEMKASHRRLAILQVLADDSDYSANDRLLQEMLSLQGFGVSQSLLRADCAWLEEQGLLVVRNLPSCQVVSLRARGVDVANGVTVVPGVARPGPA